MEKLALQMFRTLKQEIIEYANKYQEAEERGEHLSSEDEKQFGEKYKEIIHILSEHDLSDIDFEEWEGMYLYVEEEFPLDFSKTKANLDFNLINYEDDYDYFPSFVSCQVKNFDFEKYYYTPEMFDEELRNKFYEGKLSFEDIRQNPQIKELLLSKDISVG